MPVPSRWPLLLALSTGALLACTETSSVEPQPLPEPGTRRIVLDLGLDPLPDGGEPDLDPADLDPADLDPLDLGDAADPGDGDLADRALVDATPADGQNGDE